MTDVPPIVFGLEPHDTRTHSERIYDLEGSPMSDDRPLLVRDVRKNDDLPPTEWAADDHPMGAQWPYRTMIKSIGQNSVPLAPGSIVLLYPHEVAKYHRLAKDILDRAETPVEVVAVAGTPTGPVPAVEGEPLAPVPYTPALPEREPVEGEHSEDHHEGM